MGSSLPTTSASKAQYLQYSQYLNTFQYQYFNTMANTDNIDIVLEEQTVEEMMNDMQSNIKVFYPSAKAAKRHKPIIPPRFTPDKYGRVDFALAVASTPPGPLTLGQPERNIAIGIKPKPRYEVTAVKPEHKWYYFVGNFNAQTLDNFIAWRQGADIQPDTVRPQVIYVMKNKSDMDFWRPMKNGRGEIVHHKDIGTFWVSKDYKVALALGDGRHILYPVSERRTENAKRTGNTELYIDAFFNNDIALHDARRLAFDPTTFPRADMGSWYNIKNAMRGRRFL